MLLPQELKPARPFSDYAPEIPLDKYYYFNGPVADEENGFHAWKVEELLETGVNCQLLVQIVLEELMLMNISTHLRSKELFEDSEHSLEVGENQKYQLGDIFFFHHPKGKSEADSRFYHVAVLVEQNNSELWLAHAYSLNGQNSSVQSGCELWTLEHFVQSPYGRPVKVKRLRNHQIITSKS